MAKSRNPRSVFELGASFPPTRWTAVASAAHREAVKVELYKQYLNPLYCWARRQGHTHEDAKDFTQDFLEAILLGKKQKLLARADPARGHFRSLLVKAFQNYIGNARRKKRPVTGVEDDISAYQIPEGTPSDPGAAFERVWARQVLDGVLADLESECRRDGLQAHWGVFQERLVKPHLGGQRPLGLKEICRRYGVAREDQASNMKVTVQRRFERLLGRTLAGPDAAPDEVEEAIKDFLRIFSPPQGG